MTDETYFMAGSARHRERYHHSRECVHLRHTQNVIAKPRAVVERMPLEACSDCQGDELLVAGAVVGGGEPGDA